MILIRSILFNLVFYVWTAFWTLMTLLTFPLPFKYSFFPQDIWSNGVQPLLAIAGIKVEYRGLENLPKEPCLIACKHQSAWDTTVFFSLRKKAAIVVKKELLKVPVFGWYLKKIREIPIDRSAGGSALKEMVRASREALSQGRSIIIFPEGTRVGITETRKYQPGVYALYSMLKAPIVPVALNSGVFWPRRKFLRKPGTIVLEFLPVIKGGLSKEVFMKRLEDDIEGTTKKLVAAALKETRR